MSKGNRNFFVGALLVVALSGGLMYIGSSGGKVKGPEQDLSAFAQCIADSQALFYGAFWCPHCQNQKKMFGDAEKFLPYIECSTPDGRGQLPVCKDADVTGYPTWIFADGSRLSGEASLETLAAKTGCALPPEEEEAPLDE